MSRRVAVFTSSRADLGPLGPVVRALDAEPAIDLLVVATGTHVGDAFGGRLEDIRLSPGSRLEVLDAGLGGTRPADLGETYGRIAAGTSRLLAAHPVDLLVLLGDRWELLAAAGAALLHGVPIAHLHGGETTEGAIDERIRHGVTKLADLHLCASEDSARRIRHLGEEPWRIVVTGAPGLDRLREVAPLGDERLAEVLGRPPARPFGVVVYHAPTVDRERVRERARAVYQAAAETLASALVLYPGADPGSEAVVEELEAAVARHPRLAARRNLGDEYLAALKAADVLVGNSSSGIIEAASLALPAVDVGERQRGRLRPGNVLHVGESEEEIAAGIRRALAPAFRAGLAGLVNPYGDGAASERIVAALLAAPLDRLTRKPLIEPAAAEAHLEALTVGPDATLRDALAAIQRGGAQITFLVDGDGLLLGSLSDGDVRRALLAGAALADGCAAHANRVPVVATPADDLQRVAELMEQNGVAQVPVVDGEGRLIGLHLMRAIVGRALDQAIGGWGGAR
ncbi:MAG TPA: UDP-N-acetylglucosamine 2-epimerase [Thermoanaerobaculia bacterium]|nr:UDP-N-acetylglucosamine 2-epimerase [Thermoanaerobaculia bacterium]